MLRILPVFTTTHPERHTRIRLVGQVHGEWVAELRRLVADLLEETDRLEIDMAEVSFVDAGGLEFFREAIGARVALLDCALFVAEQLKTLELDV